MDVIRHDFNLLQVPSVGDTRLTDDLLKPISQRADQNIVAVLGTPNNMVSQAENGVTTAHCLQGDSLSRRVWRCATTPERRDSSPASFCRVSSPSGCRVQFRRGCSVR